MKIAIVGSGISGLSAAYYLSKKHKVDLFEKGDHFGGHAYTIDLNIDNNDKQFIPVDIGFIVFNHYTYPNLIEFFYKRSSNLNLKDNKLTLGQYLEKEKLSNYFINYHIIPMVSAIWSMPPYEAKQMPFAFFLKFFQNHGLFKIKNRPQWYTVKDRSRSYVNKVLKNISGEHYKNYEIKKVKKSLILLVSPESKI